MLRQNVVLTQAHMTPLFDLFFDREDYQAFKKLVLALREPKFPKAWPALYNQLFDLCMKVCRALYTVSIRITY